MRENCCCTSNKMALLGQTDCTSKPRGALLGQGPGSKAALYSQHCNTTLQHCCTGPAAWRIAAGREQFYSLNPGPLLLPLLRAGLRHYTRTGCTRVRQMAGTILLTQPNPAANTTCHPIRWNSVRTCWKASMCGAILAEPAPKATTEQTIDLPSEARRSEQGSTLNCLCRWPSDP